MADEEKNKSHTEEHSDHEDEVLGKAYDANLMKRLLKYLKPYFKWVVIAIILTIGVALASTVRPYLTKIAIDNYIANKDANGLRNMIFILLAAIFFQGLLQ